MRVLKLFIVAAFAAALLFSLARPSKVSGQAPTEAPAAFDNMTNGFELQGTPVPTPDQNPTPGTFEADKFIFSKVDEIGNGLGPVYNAQSCRECHQNPVTGGISQISELRAGHSAADGTFVDAPGGSLINDRAIDPLIQERVPDGSRIVTSKNGAQIFVMGFDGGQYGEVVNDPVLVDPLHNDTVTDAAFSFDGKKYVFSKPVSGIRQIFVMNVDGTGLTQLTNDPNAAVNPAWSPDGTTIAFQSSRSGGSLRIWIMETDGTNPTLLLKQSFNSFTSPHWSPDSGENIRTFRTSLNLLGDGFVEATDDSTLLAIQAAQPVDMRGTAISVPIFEAPGQTRIGRFGWKDQLASLLSFSSDAYLNEIGITNRFNLVENTSLGRSVAAFDTVSDNQPCDSDSNVNCGEDPEEDINTFTRFMRSTKAPPRDRNLVPVDSTDPGSALFDSLSCSVCHTRSITTTPDPNTTFNGGTFTVGTALANKTFHPFGDFLLHDIGTGDGIVQNGGQTTRLKVRTAPLWGVRTRTLLMHDGLSLTFMDAIERHAVEAEIVRQNFEGLSPDEQRQLIIFLESL